MENLAWFGSILLAFCAVPEAYYSVKRGRNDNSYAFLLMWLFGEVFTLIYVLSKKDYPLVLNYTANLFFIGIILRYKVKPRLLESRRPYENL